MCDWTGSIVSLRSHIETECVFSLFRCPNNCSLSNVGELYSGAELSEHRKTCPMEPLTCPSKCSAAITIVRKDLSEHLQHSCMRRMTNCLFCNQQLVAADLQQHLEVSDCAYLPPSKGPFEAILRFCLRAKHYDLVAEIMLHPDSPIHIQHAATGQTSLYRAASDGDAELIKALLRFDPSKVAETVLIVSIDGVSPLMAAIDHGHRVAAKLLLDANPSEGHLLLTDRLGWSALSYAMIKGDLETLRLLLDANPSDDHLHTVSHAILFKAPAPVLKLFLSVYSSSIHRLRQRSRGGLTLLMKMVLCAPISITKLLLQCDASDEHLRVTNNSGRTALMLASLQGNTQVVKLLLDRNSNQEHLLATDANGHTAREIALSNQKFDVAELLKQAAQSSHYLNHRFLPYRHFLAIRRR